MIKTRACQFPPLPPNDVQALTLAANLNEHRDSLIDIGLRLTIMSTLELSLLN